MPPRLQSTDNQEPTLTPQSVVPALVPQARGAPAHIWLGTTPASMRRRKGRRGWSKPLRTEGETRRELGGREDARKKRRSDHDPSGEDKWAD